MITASVYASIFPEATLFGLVAPDSEEYDTSKIRTQAINEIYPSLDWEDYKRRYAIYQKKIRDYIEQKASEVLKTYEGIQSEVSTIKDRIDSISETLKQIQNKHSLKF